MFYYIRKLLNTRTELFDVALFSYLSPEINFSFILLILRVIVLEICCYFEGEAFFEIQSSPETIFQKSTTYVAYSASKM